MTPAQRAVIRSGCNLAELSQDLLAEIAQERHETAERRKAVAVHAARIFAMRNKRITCEAELVKLGDLEPAVRARLNKMLQERRA